MKAINWRPLPVLPASDDPTAGPVFSEVPPTVVLLSEQMIMAATNPADVGPIQPVDDGSVGTAVEPPQLEPVADVVATADSTNVSTDAVTELEQPEPVVVAQSQPEGGNL